MVVIPIGGRGIFASDINYRVTSRENGGIASADKGGVAVEGK